MEEKPYVEKPPQQLSSPSTGLKSYTHPTYKFSLEYPEGFNVSSFDEEPGEMVLFQKPGTKDGFQVFVTAFDEPGPITFDRVKKDIPDLIIESPQETFLGPAKNIRALIFFSSGSSLGKTREVWFIWPENPNLAGNYFYQVTAPAEFDAEFSKIMATYTFIEVELR